MQRISLNDIANSLNVSPTTVEINSKKIGISISEHSITQEDYEKLMRKYKRTWSTSPLKTHH